MNHHIEASGEFADDVVRRGASSMERLPTETAMTENMRRFKAIATGKGEV